MPPSATRPLPPLPAAPFRAARHVLRIAGATAIEGLQQTVVLLLTLAGTLVTCLGPIVALYTFGEEGRLARDSGLALLLVPGLFIVAFTAGATVHDELRRGTAAAVLAKPVSRLSFLLGKWLGVTAVLATFAAAQTLATLLAERTATHFVETDMFLGSIVDKYTGLGSLAAIALALLVAAALNYFRRMRFALSAMLLLPLFLALTALACGFVTRSGAAPAPLKALGGIRFAFGLNGRVLPAALLVFALLSLFAAIASALSTRLGSAPTVLILGILLFLGFFAESAFARSPAAVLRLLYPLLPDVQHYWQADSVAAGRVIPLRYLARALLGAAAASGFWLGVGTLSLRSKDIG